MCEGLHKIASPRNTGYAQLRERVGSKCHGIHAKNLPSLRL